MSNAMFPLKLLPELSADQLQNIAISYAKDLPKLIGTHAYYETASKVAIVISVIGCLSSTPIEEKDKESKTFQNRLLRTAFVYGAVAFIYYFYKTTFVFNQIEYAQNMARFCIDHIPTPVEVS